MALLKREVQVKIDGQFLKGSVVNGKFRTNELVQISSKGIIHNGYSGHTIRKIIEELEELANIVEANEVTEELAKEHDALVSANANLDPNDPWGILKG